MAKKSQHGGKREGAGRKPVADDQRRDKIFAVKLTSEEKRLLDDAHAGKWARTVLLSNAKRRVK
jgi:hypothetical protein